MNMKKYYFFLTLLLLIQIVYIPNVNAQPLEISAPNAILMDYTTGKVIFEHNAHIPTFPASTTKLLTAVLVLENADLDEVVTVDYDSYVLGSSMYLLKGESFTVEELLKTLMVRSANDVAELLAIHISGSVEDFAILMNARAKELGAQNSNFVNPHGLHNVEHVTTAYDLAVIARHALQFDKLKEIMGIVNLQFEPTEQTPETRYFRNTNQFLWATGAANKILYNGRYEDIKYDIIDGVKTGYTSHARNCLIASANKNDHRLISVVLGANGANVYSDSRTLIDYGYDNFKLVNLAHKDQSQSKISIKNAKIHTASLYSDSDFYTLMPIGYDESLLTIKLNTQKNIKAPIAEGVVLGNIEFIYDSDVLGSVNLVNISTIEAQPIYLRLITTKNLIILFVGLFALWQGFVIYLRLSNKKIHRFGSKKYNSSYTFSKRLFK